MESYDTNIIYLSNSLKFLSYSEFKKNCYYDLNYQDYYA